MKSPSSLSLLKKRKCVCVQGGVRVAAVVSDSNTDPASNCATIRKKLRYMVPISVQFTDTSHLSVSN